MNEEWIPVAGIVVPGHKVASAPSNVYPYGSLVKQIPYFKILGLDLTNYYPGTINITLTPLRWMMRNPEFTFRHVNWTDLHPPEDFSFSSCQVVFRDNQYPGWVYYPHPETKIRHFQDPYLIEVITDLITGLSYGSRLSLKLRAAEITLEE